MSSLNRSCRLLAALCVLCFAASLGSAQITTPRPSQKASVMQRIGVTDVTITYSRPGVKGRTIWGDPLPEQKAQGEATRADRSVGTRVARRRERSDAIRRHRRRFD
jgi:hypothetical protein